MEERYIWENRKIEEILKCLSHEKEMEYKRKLEAQRSGIVNSSVKKVRSKNGM